MPLCRYIGFSLVLRQIHDTKLCPGVRATCVQNNTPDCQNLPWSSFESVALTYLCKCLGFPCGSASKESARNARDLGSVPRLGRSPGEGKSYPLQYSSLENFMDSIVHGVTKSQTWLSDFQFYTSLWGLTCLALKPEKSLWPQFQSSVVWMPQLTFTSESLKVCLQYHWQGPTSACPEGTYLPIQDTGTCGLLLSPSWELSPPEDKLGAPTGNTQFPRLLWKI